MDQPEVLGDSDRDSIDNGDVRYDVVLQVDEEHDDEDGGEEAGRDQLRPAPGQPEPEVERGKRQRRQQLHPEVAPGDLRATVPAAGAQEDLTQQGDQVDRWEAPVAAGTVGRRVDDGLFTGQPPDADV